VNPVNTPPNNLTQLFDHYLDKLLVERDRRYEDRFKAIQEFVVAGFKEQKEAVAAALAAQKEITSNAFVASEKAIVKAEESQRDTNNKSNEFRGQLKDQNETMIPRIEAQTKFDALDEKLDTRQVATERRLDELGKGIASLRETAGLYPSRNELATIADGLKIEISSLRETRSNLAGQTDQKKSGQELLKWALGVVVAVVLFALGYLLNR